jgi:hypothetical protein
MDLWHETHNDLVKQPVTYDTIIDLTKRYASAIRSVNPTAQVFGPNVWYDMLSLCRFNRFIGGGVHIIFLQQIIAILDLIDKLMETCH